MILRTLLSIHSRWTQKFLFTALTGLGMLGFTLGLCEILARALAPAWLSQRMRIINPSENTVEFGSDRGWKIDSDAEGFLRFKPHSSFQVQHYEYSTTAHFDELGGRAMSTATPKTANKILPILGDSFTFGVGVEDDATFASLWNNRAPVRILNLGVPGTCLREQIAIVRRRHREIGTPSHYIFVVFLGNDIIDLPQRNTDSKDRAIATETQPSKATAPSFFARLNQFVYHQPLLKKSYLIQLARQPLLKFINRKGTTQMNPLFQISSKQFDVTPVSRTFESLLDEVQKTSQQLNFRYSFILIPDLNQVLPKKAEWLAESYGVPLSEFDLTFPNRFVAERLRARKVAFLDTTDCLKNSKEALYFEQDNHLRAPGHRVVADCAYDFVSKSF